jgi:hypothetical protein
MRAGDFMRWLYRDRRPHRIASVLNRIWATVGSAGLLKGWLATLEVIGRQSGRVVSLPVIVAVVDGQRYLVSMLGNDASWVKNVRDADGHAILRCRVREPVFLEELPAAERPSILKAYLRRAPGARPHIPVDKDADLAEFAKIAPAFPVFRVRSRATQ